MTCTSVARRRVRPPSWCWPPPRLSRTRSRPASAPSPASSPSPRSSEEPPGPVSVARVTFLESGGPAWHAGALRCRAKWGHPLGGLIDRAANAHWGVRSVDGVSSPESLENRLEIRRILLPTFLGFL